MWIIYVHLIFLHLLALAWGIHSGMGGHSSALDIFFPLAMAVAVVYACATDARIRLTPLTDAAKIIMFFTWPIAGPLYLIWSRRWIGILWAILWFVSIWFFCYFLPAVFLEALRTNAR